MTRITDSALWHILKLSNALAAIHSRPEQAWSVESLAEQCCMSPSKFANLFNQVIGEPPLAYLQQHRLRLASHYLQQGQLSIQQIAHPVGYSSETAFSQTFKKQYELTPNTESISAAVSKQQCRHEINSLTI